MMLAGSVAVARRCRRQGLGLGAPVLLRPQLPLLLLLELAQYVGVDLSELLLLVESVASALVELAVMRVMHRLCGRTLRRLLLCMLLLCCRVVLPL